MYKRDITYSDYNGNEITDTFYFNLNKAELMKIAFSKGTEVEEYYKKIVDNKDVRSMYEEFDNFVRMSYGKKSEDGIRFIKNKQILEEFVESYAYSELMYGFITDPDTAMEFFNGIIPHQLLEEAKKRGTLPQEPAE